MYFLIDCREIKLDEAAVLHYTYPKFSDLTSRRDRCGCKPTKEDVKRCFMLEFDRAVSNRQAVVLNHVNLDYNHNVNANKPVMNAQKHLYAGTPSELRVNSI